MSNQAQYGQILTFEGTSFSSNSNSPMLTSTSVQQFPGSLLTTSQHTSPLLSPPVVNQAEMTGLVLQPLQPNQNIANSSFSITANPVQTVTVNNVQRVAKTPETVPTLIPTQQFAENKAVQDPKPDSTDLSTIFQAKLMLGDQILPSVPQALFRRSRSL
jgi:hypothetical protein